MQRRFKGLIAPVVCVLLLGLRLFGAEQSQNLLKDGGFESARAGNFLFWQTPTYWQGKLAPVEEKGQARTGARCAELTATEKGGKWWGRVLNQSQLAITQGARYKLSVWARGRGALILGCIEYGTREGKTTYHYAASDSPAALTDKWQEAVFHYIPQEPTASKVAVYVEVQGEGGRALLDEAFFAPDPIPGYSLTVRALHTMMPMGGTLSFQIRTAAPAGETSGAVLVQHQSPSGEIERGEVQPDSQGKAVWDFSAPKNGEQGLHAFVFVLKKAGLAETAYVDVVDRSAYDAYAAAVGKVRLEAPAHLIFVGDSLTAFYRGYNYVDKVRGWLQKKFGDSVQVTNAGVGGDYTTRVLARLEKDVLTQNPTHVFIFLGHNDSKLKSTSNYKEAVVPPETFEKEYREIVRQIQARTKARVTIISATSSVYEITKATAEAAQKAGRPHNLFGKPEALELYNAIARKVARDLGAGYLDVYEPTRIHPNKPGLFTSDGVHINNEGNRLVALEILRYLGKEQ